MAGKKDLGKPVYNLEIKVQLGKSNFPDHIFNTADLVEIYGKAVTIAKNLVGGYDHVTDKGYVLKGHKIDLSTIYGEFEIDDNVSDIITLDRILNGEKLPLIEICPFPHFHSKNKKIYHLEAEGNSLYIPEIRQEYEPRKVAILP